MKPNYQKAQFMLSVAELHQLPADTGKEVAIIGRSNAGKSSILNQLTQNKGLARVSKTPGRTQHINMFSLGSEQRLADLPGYGYAKVPPKMKAHWEKTLDEYFRERNSLMGLVLVMDIRHPLKEFDQVMLAWCNQCDLPVHVLLNKSDKLTFSAIKQTETLVRKSLSEFPKVTLQIFSATKAVGVDELRKVLDQWLTN